MPKSKRTILVDFDGVVNSYKSGWQGTCELPDPPVPNAIDWLQLMCLDGRFDMCIYSSRSKEANGPWAMRNWLVKHGLPRGLLDDDILRFPTEKPAAFLTIDDRVWLFLGEFPTPDQVNNFQPWTKAGDGGLRAELTSAYGSLRPTASCHEAEDYRRGRDDAVLHCISVLERRGLLPKGA